jgi:arylsulfatase A-like enzyme
LALPWIRDSPDYHPHPELADVGLSATASYDAEITFMDRQLARLVRTLDERAIAKDTVLVVVADHGEGLGDHGDHEHGYLLSREVLRVPLIVVDPRESVPGRRTARLVSLAELYEVMLALTLDDDAFTRWTSSWIPTTQTPRPTRKPIFPSSRFDGAPFGASRRPVGNTFLRRGRSCMTARRTPKNVTI